MIKHNDDIILLQNKPGGGGGAGTPAAAGGGGGGAPKYCKLLQARHIFLAERKKLGPNKFQKCVYCKPVFVNCKFQIENDFIGCYPYLAIIISERNCGIL